MRVRHNISSLIAWRSFSDAGGRVDQSIGRLSSGLRIQSASDDAAGLSISERIRSQFMSLAQASKNAMDGIALLNTADGALQQVLDLLQRGRELSVQAANGVYSSSQKTSIQSEVDQILAEVDRISDDTQYNSRSLFSVSGGAAAISNALTGLHSGWLQGAEQIISTYYGITGDTANLNINLQQGAAGAATSWISGTTDVNGLLKNITMTFDPTALSSAANPARLVARALTQAVLARNSNYTALKGQYSWFISGASDFIAGGNDMVQTALQSSSVATIVNAINGPWVDDLTHQASAYVAVKYLNTLLTANGATMADVMSWLKMGADLDTALSFTIGMDAATFVGDFLLNGQAYLNSLVSSGTLAAPDVGGIHPGTAATVIPSAGTYSNNPTTGFKITWPPSNSGPVNLTLQVGAQATDHITVALPQVSRYALNLLGIDTVTNADDALNRFGSAISLVTTARSQLGAASATLEHTASVDTQEEIASRDAFSRIRDVDFAHEVTAETKQQILVSASGLVLAKANRLREHTAWLLSALPTSMGGASAG